MKYITFLTLLIILNVTYFTVAADQEELPRIVFSELSLGNADSASNEFIEIENLTVFEQDLKEVELQYKSKNGSNWQTKSVLSGTIAPYGTFLISNYLDASQDFSGGLAASSGHLRLVSGDAVLDFIAWGDASEPEGQASAVHDKLQSLKRIRNEDGVLQDTNVNSLDWFVSDSPSPSFDEWPLQIAEEDESEQSIDENKDTPEPDAADDTVEEPIADQDEAIDMPETEPEPSTSLNPSQSIEISELLPDPVSPMTDADHEFVELYNPGSSPVDLTGYVLQSGSEWRYKYTLPSYILDSGERIAVYSATSGLTLSNSGSQVRILGPDEVEHSFVEYEKAKPGASWSKLLGGWDWSNPSPNAQNSSPSSGGQPDVATVASASVRGSATKQTDESLEKKTIKYPEAVSGDSDESDSENSQGSFVEEQEPPRQINNLILAGIAGVTVLYAVYEYRQDIRIRCQQLTRYLKLRAKTWRNS